MKNTQSLRSHDESFCLIKLSVWARKFSDKFYSPNDGTFSRFKPWNQREERTFLRQRHKTSFERLMFWHTSNSRPWDLSSSLMPLQSVPASFRICSINFLVKIILLVASLLAIDRGTKSPFPRRKKTFREHLCDARCWMNGIIVNTLWIYGNIGSPFRPFSRLWKIWEEWQPLDIVSLAFVSLTNSFCNVRKIGANSLLRNNEIVEEIEFDFESFPGTIEEIRLEGHKKCNNKKSATMKISFSRLFTSFF